MNAIELADEFELLLKEREEHPWGNFEILYDLTATMLRQQQAEIEALKYEKSSGVYDIEPVAWIDSYDLERLPHYDCHIGSQQLKNGIPLYTHPVKELHLSLQKSKETGELLAVTYTDDEHRIVEVFWQKSPVKELTDEEITEVITKIANNNEYVYSLYEDFEGIEFSRVGIFEFARAILRKAQEK